MRSVASLLAGLGVGTVVGAALTAAALGLGTCGAPDPEPPAPRDAARTAPPDAPSPERAGGRARARPADPASPRGAPQPSPAPTDDDAAPPLDERAPPPAEAADAVALDVDVVSADGVAEPDAVVYVLPAGEPGTDQSDDVPHAETDAAGRASVRLVRAGRYDVGAIGEDDETAFVRDVDVPRDGPLRVTLARVAEVALFLDGPPPTDPATGAAQTLKLSFTHVAPGTSRRYPGRGEAYASGFSFSFGPGETETGFNDQQGRPFRVEAPGGWIAEPGRAAPPARIVVRPDDRVPLTVSIHLEPGAHVFTRGARLALEIDAGAGSAPRPWRDEWVFVPGERLEDTSPQAEVRVPRGRWTLRWSGEGVRRGEAAYDTTTAPDGAPPEVEIPVACEPDALPENPVFHDVVLRFEEGEGARGVRGDVFYAAQSPPDGWDTGSQPWDEPLQASLPRDAALLLVTEFGVAGPLRPAGAKRFAVPDTEPPQPQTVVFSRGGCLVVVPDGPEPRGAGNRVLRRADGAPFPCADPDDEAGYRRWREQSDFRAGTILGPFPPGDVAFEVRTGRVLLGEAVGRVVAGRYTPLRVPVR